MIKRPLVLGAQGNMGRRYMAILKTLGATPWAVDAGDLWPRGASFDAVLIATPTISHLSDIRKAVKYGVPILCEKPISTRLKDVLELCQDMAEEGVHLRMVNQYQEMLQDPEAVGPTSYDYFRHGSDGLLWDCISIIALANGPLKLDDRSPIWTCQINGETLSLADMDAAYVSMIRGWLNGDTQDLDGYIRKAHTKVQEYLEHV